MSMLRGKPAVGVIGAAIAMVLSLSACGGEAPGPPLATAATTTSDAAPAAPAKPAADLAREAPDVTRAAGTSRFAVEFDHEATGGPLGSSGVGPLSMTGEGTYDFTRQIGQADYATSGAGLPTEQLDVVFRNNVAYHRPVDAQRWQEWDYSAMVNTPIGQHDPSQQLDLLRGVSDDVREVGPAQVRGTDVRQYAITIDPARLARQQDVVVDGGPAQAALQAAGPMPGTVFVDHDGRVRRLEVQITVSGADLAASMPGLADNPAAAESLRTLRTESRIAVEFFDFGVPVTAQVPDAALVDPAGIPQPR